MPSSNNYNYNYSFAEQLKAFNVKVSQLSDVLVRRIVFGIGVKLVERSPVGDPDLWKSSPPPGYVGGRFRANWQYGLDQVNTLTTDDVDETGETSLTELAKVPGDATGHIHYYTNSLPYAQALEDGHSTQAPFGMVALTLADFKDTLDDAIAYVRANPV